jgi:hypothetical protein
MPTMDHVAYPTPPGRFFICTAKRAGVTLPEKRREIGMKALALIGVTVLGLTLPGSAMAGNKLFVGGLSWGTSSEEVERHVAPFGPVERVLVASIDRNGELSARATVVFERARDARAAAQALDGTIIGDQPISAEVREVVVVGSKVKEVITEAGLRSDGDLVQAVSDKVHQLLGAAIKRTKANGRSTVRPFDL